MLFNNLFGIGIALVIIGIGFKLAPKNVSVAGHDAGQLFLLAALPLFFIDFGTSAEYAAGELHYILAEHGLQVYAPYGVLAIGLFNLAFGSLYLYALGVFRDGGGAYTASLRYLGTTIAIVVAFLLLQDYVLTVVVSSLSGADQLLSTIGQLNSASPIAHIILGIGVAWLTCWLTLRGRRDAARITFVVLWTYVAFMVLTFISLAYQSSNGIAAPNIIEGYKTYSIPTPEPGLPLSEIISVVANATLHGLVALTGLEAVSNGLPFIKNQDANYVHWLKQKLPRFNGLWQFFSGRVGVGRTIQFGFLFYGGLTLMFNSHFANFYGVGDRGNGMTLVGNLAYIGLVPIGGYALFFIRQIWSALTLSFANMTAYEDIQSTAYRYGVAGLMPISLVYRSPNGNFPRPVLLAFGLAVLIIVLVGGNTSAAIPFYGIGVFAPIAFMGFSVARHLQVAKPKGYRAGSVFSIFAGCLSLMIFAGQVLGKFSEGGWVPLVAFALLFLVAHFLLLSARGERFDKLARYFITGVSRIQGSTAELLMWQTQAIQTYRSNLWARLTHWHTGDQRPLKLEPYPPYQTHYEHDDDYEHHPTAAAAPAPTGLK
jgi:amino acid transporter